MPQYQDEKTKNVGEFVSALRSNSLPKSGDKSGGTFDAVGASDFVNEAKHGRAGVEMPAELSAILDSVSSGDAEVDAVHQQRLSTAILDGANYYEEEHGEAPRADLLLNAFHQAASTTPDNVALAKGSGHTTYDNASASSDHHNQHSMIIGRASVAILQAIAEAVPFASYLPAAVESNESKLIIVGHHAGSDWGSYRKGDLMDGNANGKPYIDSSRTIRLTDTGGNFAGQITSLNDPADSEVPITIAAGAQVVKLLRGRTKIYVSGIPAAREAAKNSAVSSPIVGNVTLDGVNYSLSGSVKPDTGEIEVTANPALPANTSVHAEGYVDYETQPELTPYFATDSEDHVIYANAWRALTSQTIDSRTQFANEIGLDISTEAMMALRTQFANERHKTCLSKAGRLAELNNKTWTFDTVNQQFNKSFAQIISDIGPTFAAIDQRMVDLTMDYSSKYMYVGKKFAALLTNLPADMFKPSGVNHRPGIYRLGSFAGKIVYLDPDAVEGADFSDIKLIGQSNQVSRSPFILGDAVPPIAIALGNTPDFNKGNGLYSRSFTEVNPHAMSAMGVGSVRVSGLPV